MNTRHGKYARATQLAETMQAVFAPLEISPYQQYATIAFTQGPRNKHNATREFEKLIKDILQDYHQNKQIKVAYNSQSELLITANDSCYNLTLLLNNNPDFEQLEFNQSDIQFFEAMLCEPKAVLCDIEHDTVFYDPKSMPKIKNAYPNLTRGEVSAIHNYTGMMYPPFYFLMKHKAKIHFPRRDDISEPFLEDVLDRFAAAYDPNYKWDGNGPPDYDYNFDDPVLLAHLMREVLVNAAFAAAALTKNIQDELNIIVASSNETFERNREKLPGISLVIIKDNSSNQTNCKAAICAYSKADTDMTTVFNLEELLQQYIIKPATVDKNDKIDLKDGIGLSADEYQTIINHITSAGECSQLNELPVLLRTKLIDILCSQHEIESLLYKKLYRVEEDPQLFVNTTLPELLPVINTDKGYFNCTSFCSTSTEILYMFEVDGVVNVLYTFANPIAYGKNIECLSKYEDERERLFVPCQQVAVTRMHTELNQQTKKMDVYLDCYPIRSLDGLQSPPDNFTSIVPVSASHAALFTKSVSTALNEQTSQHLVLRLKK